MRDTVATTILQQMGGAGRLKLMINAHDFIADTISLTFKFSGSKKAKAVMIKYDCAKDLYDMIFFRNLREHAYESDKIEGVYNDQLQPLFYDFTGLYLTI